MAIIKAVSSRASLKTAIDYVCQKSKTKDNLISSINCNVQTAYTEMQATKQLWGKMHGRTYKHYTQSFNPGEASPELIHKIAIQLANEVKAWKGYEILIATHQDRKHLHTHFIVNSVRLEDGKKLQWSKKDLKEMKNLSDNLCRKYNLSICKKGKTVDAQEREETTSFNKNTYALLKKAEKGNTQSYVQDIALAILDCKEESVSKADFIQKMLEHGYKVDWQDNHKYITFTDLARQKDNKKLCKVRNNRLQNYYNINFSKEELENEFKSNARAKETREKKIQRGRDSINTTADRDDIEVARKNSQYGADNTRKVIDNIRNDVRDAENERQTRENERIRLDIRRQQSIEEEKCRAERAKQKTKRRKESYTRESEYDDLEL